MFLYESIFLKYKKAPWFHPYWNLERPGKRKLQGVCGRGRGKGAKVKALGRVLGAAGREEGVPSLPVAMLREAPAAATRSQSHRDKGPIGVGEDCRELSRLHGGRLAPGGLRGLLEVLSCPQGTAVTGGLHGAGCWI